MPSGYSKNGINKGWFQKGIIPWSAKMKGNYHTVPCSEEKKKKISEANKKPRVEIICKNCGNKIYVWPSKKNTRKFCSKKCQGDYSKGKPTWNKGLKGYKSGKNHYNWKGGITPINKTLRNSVEYKLWREAVFARDKWTCVFCKNKGGILQADHIKPFALYPELRFAIDNGRTLCKECHKKTETYGVKSTNYYK